MLDLSYLVGDPWAVWACDVFGNDAPGKLIWEKSDGDKDLVLGDGSTAAGMPAFTDASPGVSYYEFDGVDDYLSGWPTMPAEYTVSVAMSDSYPDGQPFVMQGHDTTIQNLLTTPGSFTGNLHNLVIFAAELTALEKQWWADYQLRRLWRDTVINPYTARLIRSGETVQEYVFTVQASPYTDYSDTGATPSPTGITWANGLTYDTGASVVTVSDEAALRSEEISIFASGVFGTGHIVDKGTSYEFSAVYAAGVVTLTFNGVSSAAIAVGALYSVGVVAANGEYPFFYINGRYADTGASTVTVDDTDTNDLLIGNQSGGSSEFSGTLKRLSIVNRPLVDAEFEMLHLAAMDDWA